MGGRSHFAYFRCQIVDDDGPRDHYVGVESKAGKVPSKTGRATARKNCESQGMTVLGVEKVTLAHFHRATRDRAEPVTPEEMKRLFPPEDDAPDPPTESE